MKHGVVLCLDVNPATVEAITRPVVDAGYDVVRETRARAAERIAEAAIVVADLREPGPALPALEGRPLVAILGKATSEPTGAVEVLVDPPSDTVVLAAVDRALARQRLVAVTEALKKPLRSLAEAVREAETAYDAEGPSGAKPHLERIRTALEELEARVTKLEEE